jgi:hypothetical protein
MVRECSSRADGQSCDPAASGGALAGTYLFPVMSLAENDPVAVEVIGAIRAGNVESLRRLLGDNPALPVRPSRAALGRTKSHSRIH